MAWRDHLLPASLDGVPFLYRSAGTGVGRRGELHEFPGRDDPFAEDLGRAAREYPLQAFILGDDYFEARDALIDVLEAPGPHVLTHPYRGDLVVKLIGKATIRESDQEGGYVEFDFTLVEAGVSIPTLFISTPATVKGFAEIAAGTLAVKSKFSLLGAIGDVLTSVANAIESAGSAVRKVNGKISAQLGLIDNITAAIDSLDDAIATLLNTPTALMNKLGGLVTALFNLVDGFIPDPAPLGVVVEEPDLVRIALDATVELFAFSSEASVIPTPTEQSEIEVAAHAALVVQMKGAALAAGATTLASLPLSSIDQAQTILHTLSPMFDEVLDADIETDVAEAFAALKAATVGHFVEAARSLPDVTSHTPTTTTPALVIAYDLYGDPDLAEDVIRRNKIRHPAFVQGGRSLEVLAGD